MRINKRGSPHILNVNFVILHFKGKEKNINQVRNKKKKAQRVGKKLYSKPGSINSKLSCNLRSKNIHCPSASIPVLRLYSYNIEQFPNAPGLQRSEITKSFLKKKKKKLQNNGGLLWTRKHRCEVTIWNCCIWRKNSRRE